MNTFQFTSFMSDFAVFEVFPGIDGEGCYFHLWKRLDYHVKDLGLMGKYKLDTDLFIRVKNLAALAFIPVVEVISTFETIATQFLQDELPLLSYFEKIWIGAPVAPDFSIQMWNLLASSSTGSTRITNGERTGGLPWPLV